MTLALDWDAYKHVCDTPDVLSRWMLEQTAELLTAPLRSELENALQSAPLPKPDDHTGGAATDMLQLNLAPEQAREVHACVAAAVAAGATTSGTRTRGLGGFEEAWREYLEHLNAASVL